MTIPSLIDSPRSHEISGQTAVVMTIGREPCSPHRESGLFPGSDAVHPASTDRLEIRRAAGYKHLDEPLTNFAANDGRCWVSRACGDATRSTSDTGEWQ